MHLLVGRLAGAIEIREISPRQGRHGGVLGRVVDAQAEPAAALIEVERAGLEHRLVLATIEVPEAHEVSSQPREISVVAHQPFDGFDAGRLRFQGLVAGQREGEAFFQARTEDCGMRGAPSFSMR